MVIASADAAPLEFLQLVADPLRWQVVGHLARSDRRVGEIALLVGKAQNLVSYHLGELRAAGLVSSRRSSADGRDTYYRLDLARCGELFTAAGAALHPSLELAPVAPKSSTDVGRRTPRVLFLCTGNSARSQIAEAMLEHRSGGAVEARSAGSHPKPLHPNAVRVMSERGIDISGRTTKRLDRFARTRFDRVITLCDKVKEICPEFPGAPETSHWSMADPAAVTKSNQDSYPVFVRTADEIESRVDLLIAELVHQAHVERSAHGRR
ncbi:MAG TPA: ArsR family transcriptional regulator [Acidimicrobiales bacterium]|nr:ArsR family transcriptional regulator [Acidimicrobiales bacterium]